MIAQASDRTRKYRVRNAHDGWRVELAETCLGVFADPADAVDMACRSAHADAGRGHVAIVAADTAPRELHCYTPPEAQTAPAAQTTPPYLRLIGG
jgi:hypothetical protein